jgi:hypothetical protein
MGFIVIVSSTFQNTGAAVMRLHASEPQHKRTQLCDKHRNPGM